jgi:hypothetical protein
MDEFAPAILGVGWTDQPAASTDGEPAKHHAKLADTATTRTTIRVISASGPSALPAAVTKSSAKSSGDALRASHRKRHRLVL